MSEPADDYTLSYYAPDQADPDTPPARYPTPELAEALESAWLTLLDGGLPVSITRGEKTLFDRDELRRACARLDELDRAGAGGTRLERAAQVIREMGKVAPEGAAAENRRAAQRITARHEAHLLFSASLTGGEARPRQLMFLGHTRNVSETGLALVVRAPGIDERYLAGEGRRLRVTLSLPLGVVEMQTVPVHYQRLEGEGVEEGYLIGVRLTGMGAGDRALYSEYLRGIGK